ncbi:MAG TPA: hypothetical protein VIR33_06390 [Thermopolyspora sp.]|jgi:hypothetical protein
MVHTAPRMTEATPPPARPLSNVTRYLCAAAYLDTVFRNDVTNELLTDPHRAVAPSSTGLDIGPVIRHCLRARDLLLLRDVLLVVVIIAGLFIDLGLMLPWLVVLAVVSLGTVRTRSLPAQLRFGTRAGTMTLTLIMIVAVALFAAIAIAQMSTFSGDDEFDGGGGGTTVLGWLLVAATVAITICYRVLIGVILARELRPGAAETPTRPISPVLAPRIDYLTSAQHANITLYSGEQPFVGAGTVTRAWAIAVELDRRASDPEREIPDIDPLELYDFVRARLTQMRDEVAHPAESLTLDLSDHVIARGVLNRQRGAAHPLIVASRPIGLLGREAIRAIIRQPKSGMRYYQRVTINTAGQEIKDENDHLVMPAEDQEIVVSAFVHLAVEGRMLYTEFVVTVLPPTADAYHLVDRLPHDSTGRIAVAALGVLRRQLLRDIVAAPFRLLRHGYLELRQAFMRARPDDYVLYDFGAKASVRELGATEEKFSYLQELDSFKYTKLIGERLNAAVLDFLEARDIDTSVYRQQVMAVINNGTMISGGSFTGPTAVGAQATVNAATPAGGAAK